MSGHDHGNEPLPPSWFEKNVDTIVRGVIAICVLLLVGDLVFHFVGHKHVHFAIEGWVGFYAVVGFISYVGLVLTAKQLRKLVMRSPDFYGDEVASADPPHPHSVVVGSSSDATSTVEGKKGLAQSRRDAEVAEEEEGEESASDVESSSAAESESNGGSSVHVHEDEDEDVHEVDDTAESASDAESESNGGSSVHVHEDEDEDVHEVDDTADEESDDDDDEEEAR